MQYRSLCLYSSKILLFSLFFHPHNTYSYDYRWCNKIKIHWVINLDFYDKRIFLSRWEKKKFSSTLIRRFFFVKKFLYAATELFRSATKRHISHTPFSLQLLSKSLNRKNKFFRSNCHFINLSRERKSFSHIFNRRDRSDKICVYGEKTKPVKTRNYIYLHFWTTTYPLSGGFDVLEMKLRFKEMNVECRVSFNNFESWLSLRKFSVSYTHDETYKWGLNWQHEFKLTEVSLSLVWDVYFMTQIVGIEIDWRE
jgi:hypothetical protein